MQCTGKYIHPVLFSAALFCSLEQTGITPPLFLQNAQRVQMALKSTETVELLQKSV